MKERVNKPRAFLSYASEDEALIERVEHDLRNCQIEPWRDRREIRDGRPWLESIFEEGLPTCDVIIAYFTENSLSSGMVAKEVDAAQIRQLADSGISFLPYVNRSETRGQMRIDLQALHCRVWNNENYYEVLPSVVAEIWRSYMERNTAIAISQEKTRRLEVELELERLRSTLNDSAFTPQEEREFQHIYSKLQESAEVVSSVLVQRTRDGKTNWIEVGVCTFRISFIEALKRNIDSGRRYFGHGFLNEIAKEIRTPSLLASIPIENARLDSFEFQTDLTPTLMIFGLLTQVREEHRLLGGHTYSHIYSEKMYRFVSWLDYHGKFSDQHSSEFIEFIPQELAHEQAASNS